ncbi:hypothetical protein TIFTF001_028921 [Ficus carica]|uniref:Uncharacterized protein n=1 Tax=Ficus carica TaxID=3494 RepID=A0AA88J2N1_FICCA|nr:hypothetical protein TIFTF001_028921 [Ficus carica]
MWREQLARAWTGSGAQAWVSGLLAAGFPRAGSRGLDWRSGADCFTWDGLESRPETCAGPAGGGFLAGLDHAGWSGARRVEPSWRYLRKKGEEKKGK